ncbi:thermonuclease family protein [Neobacillus niacini]|uniref:thermonuclease family protein n=1 Tax=Neobacillus niacini TaxID=86668 RepID=UPI0007AC0FF0|nr:thermonuclease family protein [Neobacillus niacini]MEC1525543.1 thermonuclease family protein [Neobacillus niacini]
MRKRTGVIVMIAAAASIAYFSESSLKEENVPEPLLKVTENQVSVVPVTLVDVIDGDTIKVVVHGKIETVRYLLIDTPESKSPKTCVQLYAKEALLRNSELVKSGKVTLEFEQGDVRDSYGRLLAYVYVDGESVQGILLKEGYARVAYIMNPPYIYLELYREEENLAKRGKINIWSSRYFVTKWGFHGCIQ